MLKETGALFLIDPRLHPMLKDCWSMPSEDLWITELIKPCRSVRSLLGQKNYMGECVMVACDDLIAMILRTYLRSGPGEELDAAFLEARRMGSDGFLLEMLGALGDHEPATNGTDTVWLVRLVAEIRENRIDLNGKIRRAALIARAMVQQGYDPTPPRSNTDLFSRWLTDDRVPDRSKKWRALFEKKVSHHLAKALNNTIPQIRLEPHDPDFLH